MKNLNIAAMMKQAQMMQTRMQEVQEEVGQQTVEATSGGGMVTVTANGKGEIVSIKIDPETVKGDHDMLEDLVLAAVNEAHRRADDMMKSALSKIAGPLGGGGFPF